MLVLTPSGYIDISALSPGAELVAYAYGVPTVNLLEAVEVVHATDYGYGTEYLTDTDEDGNEVLVPNAHYGWTWYSINGGVPLFKDQSIWAPYPSVTHVKHLSVGDVLLDDNDQPFLIDTLEIVEGPDVWYRLTVSGDHSFIADGITLHNASRYWVLGSATWNSSNTTNWAATSGGAGGASVPSTSDDVSFDSLSFATAYTVTHSGTGADCANMTWALPLTSGVPTFAGTGGIGVYGSLTKVATMVWTYSGTLTFRATSTGKTITNAGVNFAANVTFNGSGGEWTMQDNLDMPYQLTRTNGTVIANGKLVTISGSGGALQGTWTGSSAFYDLTMTTSYSIPFISSPSIAVTHTLTLGAAISLWDETVSLDVTTSTVLLASRTILANITATGAGWDVSAYRAGNGGGTTGVTFVGGATQYMVGSGDRNFTTAAVWASSSGGAGSSGNIPLPQDTAVLDANTGAGTVTQGLSYIGAINAANFTGTLTTSTACSFAGSITLGAGVTLTASTQTYTYIGAGTAYLTSAGKTWAKTFQLAYAGTLVLSDAFTTDIAKHITQDAGGFTDGGFAVSIGDYSGSGTSVKAVTKTGNWELTGTGAGSIWVTQASANTTISDTAGYIKFAANTANSQTFAGGSKTFNHLWLASATANTYVITGDNTFGTLQLDEGTAAHTITMPNGTTTITTAFQVLGTSGKLVTLQRTGASGDWGITKTGGGGSLSCDYVSISNCTPSGGTKLYCGTHSTDGGGNSADVIFTDVPSTVNYTLTCAAGSYTYSGVAASLDAKFNFALTCAAGSYTYTGVAAQVPVSRNLAAAAGSYAYTGVDAALTYVPGAGATNYALTCAAGSYTYTGIDAAIPVSRNFSAEAGSYSYTGVAASLITKVNYALSCAAGNYSYLGVDASLIVKTNYALSCEAGSYAYTGVAATLDYVPGWIDYELVCNAGSYVYTGKDAVIRSDPSEFELIYELVAAGRFPALSYNISTGALELGLTNNIGMNFVLNL